MSKGTVLTKNWVIGGKWETISIASFTPLIVMMISLLVGAVLGLFDVYAWLIVIGALAMTIILTLRQYEIAATIVIVVHLYADWYIGLHLIGIVMVLGLLIIFFLARSQSYSWERPRPLWPWILFLLLGIFPAIRGAISLFDTATFYPSNILGAFLIFWLGMLLAQNSKHVRYFCNVLAGLAVLLALHTIIQATTGKFLLQSSHNEAFLASVSNFQIGGAANRAGSFFVDPNWNGTFFAMMFFLPFGLFVESKSLFAKILYLAEAFCLLPALLFTYSSGAWIGISFGFVTFVIFVGRTRYRIMLPLLVSMAALVIVVGFSWQVALQLQHASDPAEVALRAGAWQTGWQVIRAFPLTGVGLGYQAYLLRADPYRVPAQYEPLEHPHNSYLELGAMAGLPVLLLFLSLVLCGLWYAWRNWKLSDERSRALIGGGIASIVALSVNSWTINGWTHPVLSMTGWLILGVVSSPLLEKSLKHKAMQGKTATVTVANT